MRAHTHTRHTRTRTQELVVLNSNKTHLFRLYILEKLLANKSFLTKGYKFFTEKDK